MQCRNWNVNVADILFLSDENTMSQKSRMLARSEEVSSSFYWYILIPDEPHKFSTCAASYIVTYLLKRMSILIYPQMHLMVILTFKSKRILYVPRSHSSLVTWTCWEQFKKTSSNTKDTVRLTQMVMNQWEIKIVKSQKKEGKKRRGGVCQLQPSPYPKALLPL